MLKSKKFFVMSSLRYSYVKVVVHFVHLPKCIQNQRESFKLCCNSSQVQYCHFPVILKDDLKQLLLFVDYDEQEMFLPVTVLKKNKTKQNKTNKQNQSHHYLNVQELSFKTVCTCQDI